MPQNNDAARLVDSQVQDSLLTPEPQPMTAWEGTGDAFKGLLRPSAAAGRSLLIAAPAALEVFGTGLTEEGKHSYYSWVDEVSNNAVDYWTPDAQTMGSAAQTVNTVAQVVGSIPQIVGTPEVFLANAALDPSTELVNQGVDPGTATGVGLVNLSMNAIGLKVPPSFGSALATRVATGAGANLALGAGADIASQEILSAGGYEDLAAGYNWRDPGRRMLDTLMGAAFGLAPNAPAAAPSERNAILTARNAQHFNVDSAPGVPVDGNASVAHQNTLSSAIDQLMRGEQVEIASMIQPGSFRAAPAEIDYVAYRRALESGGRADAKNPNSSAYGADQFTTATWRRVVARAKPAWAQGMTDAQLLAARADPVKSGEMAKALDAENGASLAAEGFEATPQNLYAAHHFGINAAKKFARAADDTPIERILSKEQIAANKYLAGKTKAEVLDNWNSRARAAGVDVPRTLARAEPAAAGAGSVLPRLTPAEATQAITERLSVLDNLASSDQLSPEAVTALREEDAQLAAALQQQTRVVEQAATPTDPLARTAPADVRRLEERRAEISDQLARSEAAAGHASAAETLRAQMTTAAGDSELVALAESLPRRRSQRRQVALPAAPARDVADWLPPGALDMAHAMQEREAVYQAMARAAGKELGVPDLDAAARRLERPTPAPQRSAAPVESAPTPTRTSTAGDGGSEPARPGQVSPESPLDAAAKVAEESPDTKVIVGQDADGQPVYGTLADAMESIEVERARAVQDAEGITAAANCALRRAA